MKPSVSTSISEVLNIGTFVKGFKNSRSKYELFRNNMIPTQGFIVETRKNGEVLRYSQDEFISKDIEFGMIKELLSGE